MRRSPLVFHRQAIAVVNSILLACAMSAGASAADTLDWDADGATAGANGGSGAWNASATTWWNGGGAPARNVAWIDQANARFAGTAGTVSLGASLRAAGLAFSTSGYVLNLNAHLLHISGAVTGNPGIRMSAPALPSGMTTMPTRGLLVSAPVVLTTSVQSGPVYAFPCLSVDGARVEYAGTWNGGLGSGRSHWALSNGATLVMAASARVNTNQDLVNSRSISVAGFAGSNVLDHAAEFDADHMRWTPTDQTRWTNDGMSVLGLAGRMTYQTRHTRNLPTVHKQVPSFAAGDAPTLVHDHHGILAFGVSTGSFAPPASDLRWIVRDDAQAYDGLLEFFADTTLETLTDLTYDGVFGKAGSGSKTTGERWAEPKTALTISPGVTLTKTGPAALIIAGTQGYTADSRLLIREGLVRFDTDPARDFQGTFGVAFPYAAMGVTGNHLRVVTEGAGKVAFAPAATDRHGIRGVLARSGTVSIGAGTLAIAGDLAMSGTMGLTLAVGAVDRDRHKVAVAGNASLGGTLVVDGTGLPDGSYVLLAVGGTLSGSFASVLVPTGWRVETSASRVTLLPIGVNHAPVASDGTLNASEDTAATGTLAASDSDGDALVFSIVAQGAKGTVAITDPVTGAYRYTPTADASGSDQFTFRARDALADSAIATMTVAIAPINDAPVATAQAVTTAEDTASAIVLAGSDAEGSPLTFAIVADPVHGTVTGSGSARIYTPAADYSGPDAFTFRVDDGDLASAPATVALMVTAVNDAPSISASPDQASSGAAIGPIAVAVADAETSAAALLLTASSSNEALLPVAGIVIGGSGDARSVRLAPVAGQTGAAVITLTVADSDGATASDAFTLTVGSPGGGNGGQGGSQSGSSSCGAGSGMAAMALMLAALLATLRQGRGRRSAERD